MQKLITGVVLILFLLSCESKKPRILVFSKTKGYRHESIEAGKAALLDLAKKNGYEADTTESADVFTDANLKNYRAVVFLNTTGDVLSQAQQNDMMRFIQAGGGFVGIHSAADTEYEWWWYGKLLGAYFKSHPQIQQASMKKAKPFGVASLPEVWTRTDELYNYKKIADDLNVLYTLDESSYQGGENGDFHPISWYHEFDGGRSFYTGLGHTPESYSDSLFLAHITDGLKYAIGEKKLDYGLARAKATPEENRFTKNVLGFNFDEPTEMDILPDGRIIFLERKGAVKMYDPKTDSIKVINTFNPCTKFEDGMLGITHDLGFEQNKWLYIYYAHPEKSANVLSRFVFDGEKIDMASEILMLEVPTQRETCCHTAGSLAFGPDKNLYLSTGDNTSPFESDGFSPADESPGRAPFDAQKSSANTNDLRGKVLRIHPEPDGTYTIPEGNLFPKGEPNTRPEIYVMGCRNPYRISIDQKTGFLYWGEVGPDAGNDSAERGPRGYDEVNQAKGPGFFGWPLFVGRNYAYAKYDFEKKSIGPLHDPTKPINTSPNNTGKTELPPVSPPFIWYPYAESPDFPLVKQGGRNAMAGPVYYSENYKGLPTTFPEYFNGKLIIYDWMRNWINLVTMDEEGKIMDIEPFMSTTTFNNIIDMAFGPDGKLYTLEYGTQWFKQNMDARLSRIDFNGGNRKPIVKMKADETSGAVPFTVNISSEGTGDPDGDAVTYELEWGSTKLKSEDGNFNFTISQPGVYKAKLTVTDDKGTSSSNEIELIAGNDSPEIEITVQSNSMFFFPNLDVQYSVSVTDNEDGSTSDGAIKPEDVLVTFDYLEQGYDMTKVAQGHQKPQLPGKGLMDASDCKSCHQVDQKSAGPSYKEVAAKYKGDPKAIENLADKILEGGSGVWGEVAMAAHPQVSREDAMKMVEFIMSLNQPKAENAIPLSGKKAAGKKPQGVYVITASYNDKGATNLPSLSSTKSYILRSPSLSGADVTELEVARKLTAFTQPDGSMPLENVKHGASATFKDVDLTGVGKMNFVIAETPQLVGGEIEVYLGSKDGEKLGTVSFRSSPKIQMMEGVFTRFSKISVKALKGKQTLVLVFTNPGAGDSDLFYFSKVDLER